MRIQRSLLIPIVATMLLLIVGVVVALAAGRGPEATFPPHSPQAAVAAYLRLLQNGQVDAAYQMTDLTVPLDQFHQEYDNWSQQSHRVVLVQAQAHGDSASVTVDVSWFSGGAFGASDQTYRQMFTLERESEHWRITGPEYLY